MTTTCVQIEFALRCSAERYHAIAEESAPRIAQVSGLRAKWWWLDRDASRGGEPGARNVHSGRSFELTIVRLT